MAINRGSLLKFIELGLTITCIGLHTYSYAAEEMSHQMVQAGTFVGFLVILVGVFVGMFSGQPVSKRVDIFFSLAGCALFIASGALAIKFYENWSSIYKEQKNCGLAKGSIAIINAAAFLFDALLTFRNE